MQNKPDQPQQPVSNQPTQKQSSNKTLWIVLGIVLTVVLVVGAYFFGRTNNTSTQSNDQTTSGISNNSSTTGNTQSSADPSQIQGVIQQFCGDVVNKDYQSAFGLLSQKEQFSEKDVSGLISELTSDFDENFHQQHASGGNFTTGSYAVTGCTTSGDPLVTQGSSSIPTTAQQHYAWTFSDNAQTTGQFTLVYENGSWKIDNFRPDL